MVCPVSTGYSASPPSSFSSLNPLRPPSNTVPRASICITFPPLPWLSLPPTPPRFARDHGPLSRPVIKQPRGRQIESVEETRERGRRGDGQPAATMVSIVKGGYRGGARPRSYLCNRSNREGSGWKEDRCELALAPSIRTFTSWTPN